MSKPPSSNKSVSVWYQRSRFGFLLAALLLCTSLILRWKMGNTAVEASGFYWLQPAGMVVMIIASFVNLWTNPKEVLGDRTKSENEGDTRQ